MGASESNGPASRMRFLILGCEEELAEGAASCAVLAAAELDDSAFEAIEMTFGVSSAGLAIALYDMTMVAV